MRPSTLAFVLWGAFATVGIVSCGRPVDDDPGARALARLQGALQGGDLAAVTDTTTLARAELLQQMARMHDLQQGHGDVTGVTESGWRVMLADLQAHAQGAALLRTFSAAAPLLGNGRCVKLAPAPVPEVLTRLPEARSSWPGFVATEVRAPLQREAARARAGRYRCEGGSAPLIALFVTDARGMLRVARVEAAP